MIIGIDLGGTRIKGGLVNNGFLIDTEIIEAESDNEFKSQLPKLKNLIDTLLKRNNLTGNHLSGLGCTFPGIVDSIQMKILSTNVKYRGAPDVDLSGWVKRTYNLPFVMDNDARVALLGEWQYGAGKGIDDLVMVTLGTGIGGAALMNGHLVRGKHFVAGCLGGHSTINYQGSECQCGNIGCVEAEASTWRLPQMIRESPGSDDSPLSRLDHVDYRLVFDLAKEGDRLARDIRDKSLKAWAFGIVNMIHAYDPVRVIVGGGIIHQNEEIIPAIQKIVNQHSWTPWGNVNVVKAQWPDHNAILGCEYLLNHSALQNYTAH